MMKLILLALAVLVLVHPSFQLKCYNCKSDIYNSAYGPANSLPKCSAELSASDQKQLDDVGFPVCKKLVEKVKDGEKTKTYIIRTYNNNQDDISPNKDFEEYTCSTDLCNSSTAATAAIFSVVLSLSLAIFINH